ncbi:uncharacterized protein LOC131284088 [Anopheles ziemanni]|uniref:uncharacterized protein LOC131260884 n=1 Tax=Anopheles coustani TaxID=139045 RepID=UPI00265AD907|nr:uncharacterized protein LOC131260884 [Anopheles coustani]XP_058168927.1 uncharacterized protein LOC131284088 [Anopheles ziemanni]
MCANSTNRDVYMIFSAAWSTESARVEWRRILKIYIYTFMLASVCCESAQQSLGALPEPVCGQISQMLDSCFRNSSPTIAVELLYSVKIPDSVEEISDRCLLFNRGMECVQHYLNVCVDQKERKIIENEVYGAKRLYEFLCRDRSYQQEFLRHKTCFYHVHHDWDACSSKFIGILKEEMTKTTKHSVNVQYMQFCCARYGYENCVANSARHKCRPDSALFLRTVARLLSTDRHFLNCDKIEHEVCSSGTKAAGWGVPLAATLAFLLAAIRRTSTL